MHRLRTWFTPPKYEDNESSQIARVLYICLVSILLAGLLLLLVGLVFHLLVPVGATLICILSALISLYLAARGHLRFATLFIIHVLILITLSLLWLGDQGLHNISLLIFPPILMLAALALDTRSFVWIVSFSIISLVGIMIIQYPEVQKANQESRMAIELVASVTLLIFTAVTLRVLTEQLRTNWLRAQNNERALSESNLALQRQISERQRQEAQELERRQMLEKVLELGKEIAATTGLELCLRTAHQSIQKGLGFDRVGLFLYDPENDTLRGAYGTNREGEIEDTSWFIQAVGEYEAWQVALSHPKGLSLIEDYQKLYQIPPNSEMKGVTQHVTTAAWAGDQPIAVIAADNLITHQPLTKAQLEALQVFAGYIGLAIQNARLNSELEQRVEDRTAQLEAAVQELESFSYSVSHDLRAPLRSIDGYSYFLLEDYQSQLDAAGVDFLQRIRSGAQRMGRLIDDLLTFSRLNRHPLQKSLVQPHGLIMEIIDELSPTFVDRQIDFVIGNLPPCAADQALLRQVYANLIGNAIKYTSPVEETRIEIGARIQEDRVVYYVRDNGVGFDMKFAGKLFGVFQRLHSDEEFEGTGVGLAIVQRVIERHGGKIWAESSPGNGAAFYFML